MGLEATCTVRFEGKSAEGKAHLEGTALSFRGDIRLDIPLKAVSRVEAKKGQMTVEFPEGEAVFDLGPRAEKWALKIRYPKGRLDKLGVKPGSKVSVLGVEDKDFWEELTDRTEDVVRGLAKDRDFIFLRVDSEAELAGLAPLEKHIRRDGSIWVLWPKGKNHIKRDHIFTASKAADLVDIKICSFSDVLSGLKVVIPKARR